MYIWSLIVCALTFVVKPLAFSPAVQYLTEEGKRTKKQLSKTFKEFLKFRQQFKEDKKMVEKTYFATDRDGDDEYDDISDRDSSNANNLRSASEYKLFGGGAGGVFYV